MKKVLYVTAECSPFSGFGSLSDVSNFLTMQIADNEFDIRIISPLYKSVSSYYVSRMEFIGSFNVALAWRTNRCSIYEYKDKNRIFYFIENDFYFGRDNLYGYLDDNERFAFFSKAVIDSLSLINFWPDLIHATDWQSALVPVYLKINYSHIFDFNKIKLLYTIQHINRQGKCDVDSIDDLLGISRNQTCILENSGKLNFMKGAIVVSDKFNTISPSYANELRNGNFALGLESIISVNSNKLSGQLLGIDYNIYNPETDKYIYQNYSVENPENKYINKIEIQKALCLNADTDIPLFIMITKLVTNRGLDIIKLMINQLLNQNIQFIILGQGDSNYENYFDDLEKRFPCKMRSIIMHDEEMAHKLFAAADYFIMPSQVEPCGRSQMIACRYGAIPIVRKVGGLADSIIDASMGGNGYVFDNFSGEDLLNATCRALNDYYDKNTYLRIMNKAMTTDFSWKAASENYIKLYNEILN